MFSVLFKQNRLRRNPPPGALTDLCPRQQATLGGWRRPGRHRLKLRPGESGNGRDFGDDRSEVERIMQPLKMGHQAREIGVKRNPS